METRTTPFSLPRVEIIKPDIGMSILEAVKRTGNPMAPESYHINQNNIKKSQIDALLEISINRFDNAGNRSDSVLSSASNEFKDLAKLAIELIEDDKLLAETRKAASDTMKEVLNTVSLDSQQPNKFGIKYTQEGGIIGGITTNHIMENDRLKTVEVRLDRTESVMGHPESGFVIVEVPMIHDTTGIEPDYKKSALVNQGGILGQLNFAEATQLIVDSTNQAAYKFEVMARKARTDLNRIKK